MSYWTIRLFIQKVYGGIRHTLAEKLDNGLQVEGAIDLDAEEVSPEQLKAEEKLLVLEAKELANAQQQGIVKMIFKERTIQQLQKLAKLLVVENEQLIALLVAENEDKLQFVAARGNTVTASMKQVSSAALPLLNGKGGGNDAFVQGGGERNISAEELLQASAASLVESN